MNASDPKRAEKVRGRILWLRDLAASWVADRPQHRGARSKPYADLMFVYGMARLGFGDTPACSRLWREARQELTNLDEIHQWLCSALSFRIRQAVEGEPHAGRLSRSLRDRLEQMERTTRYKVQRLLAHSRILEPYERVDP